LYPVVGWGWCCYSSTTLVVQHCPAWLSWQMTDCGWILSRRISRSPKFQVVSHRDLEHDSFLVFYYDLHRLGDGVSDSAKCACPRTGFLVLRRHENRKQRSWRAHLSDTRYGDKEAPRGGGKKRRILTQLFVSPLNYGFIPLSQ
jgi:hypothetical protein